MSKDDSEEKQLPATQKKLRDARKKGQIPQNRDIVVATTTIAAMLYLWFDWDGISERLQSLMSSPARVYGEPFDQATGLILAEAADLALGLLLPLLLMVVGVSILTSIVVNAGVVFSVEPIVPKLDHVNPVSGFGRLFSLKNLIEILKSLVKIAILTGIVAGISVLGLDAMVKILDCGVTCIGPTFEALVKPLVIAAIVLLLLEGMADVGLQRALFLRDMRMTKTEAKRERKDMEGDPQIRSARKKERDTIRSTGGRIGIRHATVVVQDGSRAAVGIYYEQGKTPAPVVVCKATKAKARKLLAEAEALSIPIHEDADLAALLAKRGALGNFVPQDSFEAVARALFQRG